MAAPGIMIGSAVKPGEKKKLQERQRTAFSADGGAAFGAAIQSAELQLLKTDKPEDQNTSRGVFAQNPGATPKYALHRPRDAEYRDTMARLFISIPSDVRKKEFLRSLPKESRELGEVLAITNGDGGATGTGFIDFLLTQTAENFREKAQIVDTLTDNYVAFYTGQEPPLFNYAGTLLNTYQDDQRVWMLRIYRDMLRGTRLANRNLAARIRYDNFLVTGYMESLSLSLTGDAVDHSNFQFTMRVKQMSVITASLGKPTRSIIASSSSRIGGDDATVGDTERAGDLMSEVPLTAFQLPAADSETATVRFPELQLRLDPIAEETLRLTEPTVEFTAQKLSQSIEHTELEIDAVTKDPSLNGTQKAAQVSQLLADRSFALLKLQNARTIQAFQGANASNDGEGGLSNIRGADAELLSINLEQTPRVGNRRRGIRAIERENAVLDILL